MMLLKLDFVKAFDSVNWKYVGDTMEHMGFGSKWRQLIEGYLSSSRTSVIVNGSPTEGLDKEI